MTGPVQLFSKGRDKKNVFFETCAIRRRMIEGKNIAGFTFYVKGI